MHMFIFVIFNVMSQNMTLTLPQHTKHIERRGSVFQTSHSSQSAVSRSCLLFNLATVGPLVALHLT